jgi:hypothetical protein
MRIAVVGTYRSGSSALAGVLQHLGVDLGQQSWGDHFEELELSRRLRLWWDEPNLVEIAEPQVRQAYLQRWITSQEERSSTSHGAKHPLLSLCCSDLLEAWGNETVFLWSKRDLDVSIKSLVATGWQWPEPESIQQRLWDTLTNFARTHSLVDVEYEALLNAPRETISELIKQLTLSPSMAQIEGAIESIEAYRHRRQPTSTSLHQSSNNLNEQPKIVATMLAGNAEVLVEQAVTSSIDLVDEFLLIDTGITDNTIEIVKSLAKDKFRYIRYDWCQDFAAARNFALQAACELSAQWAMTVDTDERFVFPAGFDRMALVKWLQSNPSALAWLLRDRVGTYSKERFVRLPTHLKWRGRTHEALCGFVGNERPEFPEGLFWEPEKSPEAQRRKLDRDLQILREETATYPNDPRWWYYLGQTFEGLKEYEQAATQYLQCAQLDGWPAESATACFRGAICLKELDRFREAEELAVKGLARIPKSPELLWLAGFCSYKAGAIIRAIDWSELAVQFGEYQYPDPISAGSSTNTQLVFRYRPAAYEAPFDVLRFAYRQCGRDEESQVAEVHFQRAKMIREQVSATGQRSAI